MSRSNRRGCIPASVHDLLLRMFRTLLHNANMLQSVLSDRGEDRNDGISLDT